MFFKNLNIAKKIFLVIGFSFLILVLIMGYFFNQQFNNLQKENTNTVSSYLLDLEKERIKNATETASQFLGELNNSNNDLSNQDLQELIRNYNKNIGFGEVGYFFIYDYDGNTISLPPSPEVVGNNRWDLQDANGKYILRSLAETAESGGGFVDYIYANPNTGEDENKISYVAPINNTDFFIGAGTYEGIINNQVNGVRNELENIIGNISNTLIVFLIIAAVIFTLIILFISRYISKNINKILIGMNKMAAGDLTYRLDIESTDELGKLASAYNKTAAAQKDLVGEIQMEVSELSAQSEELAASGQEVERAADEKTKIIDSETSLILFKIVNSREEMLKKMEVEADKLCNLAVDIGGTIEEISESNSENIEELDQTASKLQQASENSKANLEKTNEIVKFIKTVSDQTKMLGLNAAIEAARADVKANGFNVVADEIRKLADETGASVKEITGFIEKLNESTENTKINIDKMNQKVDQFTENEKIMTEKLHNAADQITKMAESLSELID